MRRNKARKCYDEAREESGAGAHALQKLARERPSRLLPMRAT
jgi:hypothetical protein